MLHLAFDSMVGIGSALILLGLWFGFVWWRKRDIPKTPVVPAGRGDFGRARPYALEAGWIVTEVGRQPWIVYEIMRTEQAVTGASGIWVTFSAVFVLYAAVGAATIVPAHDGETLARGRPRDGRPCPYSRRRGASPPR